MSEPRGESGYVGKSGGPPPSASSPLPRHSNESDDSTGAGHHRHREMKGLAAWITSALRWHDT